MSAAPRSIWARKGAVHIDATRAARRMEADAGNRTALRGVQSCATGGERMARSGGVDGGGEEGTEVTLRILLVG
jgi:hypothetical protein